MLRFTFALMFALLALAVPALAAMLYALSGIALCVALERVVRDQEIDR